MNPFRFEVSLRFHGGSVHPDEVSRELRRQAQFVHIAGAPRTTPSAGPLPGTYANHYCSFACIPLPGELLSEMLTRLVNDLRERSDLFARVRDSGGSTEFFIGWYSSSNSGDVFDCALLRKLAETGIDLALDVYAETLNAPLT